MKKYFICILSIFIINVCKADEYDDFISRVADNIGANFKGVETIQKNNNIKKTPAIIYKKQSKPLSFKPVDDEYLETDNEEDDDRVEVKDEKREEVVEKYDVVANDSSNNSIKLIDGKIDYSNNYSVRKCDGGGCGHYGARRDNGKRKHKGIDLLVAPKQNVTSITDGVVTAIFNAYANDNRYKAVEIKLENGDRMRYMYVDLNVKRGDVIKKGQIIGTGQDLFIKYKNSKMQNHVHFEYWKQGKPVDPTFLFS